MLPSPCLAHWVKNYWYFRFDEGERPFKQTCYPYGAFELIYYARNPNQMQWLGDPSVYTEPDLFYSGQLNRPFVLSFDKTCICAAISFHPWTGDQLFSIPANEFTNQLVHLDELMDTSILKEELHNCATDYKAIFACFEKFVFARLVKSNANTTAVKNLVLQMQQKSFKDVGDLDLSQISLSQRRLEQLFKQKVGLSMSGYLKKARFHRALNMLKTSSQYTVTALNLGYYDQAHFNHDFKKFSGLSPKKHVEAKTELAQFLITLTET